MKRQKIKRKKKKEKIHHAARIKVIEIFGESKEKKPYDYFLNLIKNLDKKRFEIIVIVPPGPLFTKLRKLKQIEVEAVSMVKYWDFHAVSKIKKIIKKINEGGRLKTIVHCHGDKSGVLGRLACISFWRRAPYVIYTEAQIASAKIWTTLILWFLDLFTDLNIAMSKKVVEFFIRKRVTRPEKLLMSSKEKETKQLDILYTQI